MEIINIYCDESCHLPNDNQKAMVMGAVWCLKNNALIHNRAIAQIKSKHNLSPFFEIKWTKVSTGKLDFYIDIVNYFFDTKNLGFRAWVIPDKSILSHDIYNQNHDDWYYKMYFYLLRNLISSERKHFIFLDIKDTRSRKKLMKLWDVLCKAKYDFSRDIIEQIQHVHSHDIGLMQLADLLIGTISYFSRGLNGSSAKNEIVSLVKQRSGLSLEQNSLPTERKFNICIWRPNEGDMIND